MKWGRIVFLSDAPISSRIHDRLNRSQFANHLAMALLNYKEIESLVVGFQGKWGSGKTSVINMSIEKIYEQTEEDDKKKQPVIIHFNPWNYSGQQQLIQLFLSELSKQLRKPKMGERLKEIGEKLERYSKLVSPIKYIPGVGSYVEVVEKAMTVASETAKAAGKEADNDLVSIKKEINELLGKQGRKIIIIIDDIDRLSNEEVRQIFQLVKTVGDLSNTIYILSFDKEVVIKALEKVQQGLGEEYLEKIIQVPFLIPPLSKNDIEQILFEQLNDIIQHVPEEDFDKTYWANIYHSGIKHFIHTLRDVNRFCNTLRFQFNMVSDEVNPVDFIAITVIQVFLPELYNEIQSQNDLFVGHVSDSYSRTTDKEVMKEKYSAITETLKAELSFDLDDFLKRLFPKLKYIIDNTSYGADWLKSWRKEKRICSPDYFDHYFRLSLTPNEIPNKILVAIVRATRDVELFERHIQLLMSEEKSIRFLERFEDFIEDVPMENVSNAVKALFNLGDKFPNIKQGFFDFDTRIRVNRVIYQLLNRCSDQETKFNILKEAMEYSKVSILTSVRLVGLLNEEQKKHGEEENTQSTDECMISPDQLKQLEALAVKKIKLWFQTHLMHEMESLPYVLYAWKRWDVNSEGEITHLINSSIQTDEGLVRFLATFLSESQSISWGDYVGRSEWELKIDSVTEFVSISDIITRIEFIKGNISDYDFTKKERQAVDKILNAYKSEREKE